MKKWAGVGGKDGESREDQKDEPWWTSETLKSRGQWTSEAAGRLYEPGPAWLGGRANVGQGEECLWVELARPCHGN